MKAHHFAHAKNADCAAGLETSLHLAAKSLLEQFGRIWLPGVQVRLYGTRYSPVLAQEQCYQLSDVRLEKRIGSIVPDVIASVKGRPIAIEIRVTHAVNETKAERFRILDLSAIEVDLSDAPRDLALAALEPLVIGPGAHKRWVFNAAANRRRNEILASGTIRHSVSRGFAVHVDGCPLPARMWRGRPYANVVDDCIGCEHAIDIGGNMANVTCGAKPKTAQANITNNDN